VEEQLDFSASSAWLRSQPLFISLGSGRQLSFNSSLTQMSSHSAIKLECATGYVVLERCWSSF